MPKSNGPFRFKQFEVHHDHCGMKVGTDAVLLGAWANPAGAKTILDIGTGSGIIALMLAQRSASGTKIDAVEIEEPDAVQAEKNFSQSPWSNKLYIHHTSIQEYKPPFKYDLAVSNPPYFNNSLLPPSNRRGVTRHTQSLSHTDLLLAAKRLLSSNGKFSVILPTEEGALFEARAFEFGFLPCRRLAFFSRNEKPQERWLLEFAFNRPDDCFTDTLILYDSALNWSAEYRSLTGDFYLSE